MNKEILTRLTGIARRMRFCTLNMIYESKSGHPGGSMSLAEILVVLYFDQLKVKPEHPEWEERDRLVLSKGHGAPMLYAVLAEKSYFPEKELQKFRKINGMLQGHPIPKIPGIDATSGSLGCGLSMGIGMAMGMRVRGIKSHVFVILGDGELNEGLVWESVMAASHFKIGNLIAIVDNNGYQNDGPCRNVMDLEPIAPKWASFGWKVKECDGHDIRALSNAFTAMKNDKDKRPKVLIAHTVKGYGVGYLMKDYKTHYSPPDEEQWESAKKELIDCLPDR